METEILAPDESQKELLASLAKEIKKRYNALQALVADDNDEYTGLAEFKAAHKDEKEAVTLLCAKYYTLRGGHGMHSGWVDVDYYKVLEIENAVKNLL